MPAPVIYYIRHGETSWNALGRLQGTRAEIDKLFGADAAPAPSATKAPQLEQIVDDRFAAPGPRLRLGRGRRRAGACLSRLVALLS